MILVNVMLSGDDCHCIMPVLPVNVMAVELPEQRVPFAGVAVPPAETGLTVTVAVVELAEAHTPLVTTAL